MKKINEKGILLNADINGAINIMRKWSAKKEIPMKKISGIRKCNPRVIKLKEYLNVDNSLKLSDN